MKNSPTAEPLVINTESKSADLIETGEGYKLWKRDDKLYMSFDDESDLAFEITEPELKEFRAELEKEVKLKNSPVIFVR